MFRLLKKGLAVILALMLLLGTIPFSALAEATSDSSAEMATEAPVTEAPATKAPVTEAPPTEAPPAHAADETETPSVTDTPAATGEQTAAPDTVETAAPTDAGTPGETPEATATLEATATPEVTATPEPVTTPVLAGFNLAMEGDALAIIRYYGGDAAVRVPASVDGIPVVRITGGAFADLSGLESVTVDEGILAVESGAFQRDASLRAVSLPASVQTIPTDAIQECPLVTVSAPEGSAAAAFADAFASMQAGAEAPLPESMALLADPVGSGEPSFWDAFSQVERNPDGWFAAPQAYQRDDCAFACYQLTDSSKFATPQDLSHALAIESTNGLNAKLSVTQTDGAYRVWVHLMPANAGTERYTVTATVDGVVYTLNDEVDVSAYDGVFSDSNTVLHMNSITMQYLDDAWHTTLTANIGYSINNLLSYGDSGELEKWNWYIDDHTQIGRGPRYYRFPLGESTHVVFCEYGRNLRTSSEPFTVTCTDSFDDYFASQYDSATDATWYYAPGHDMLNNLVDFRLNDWLSDDLSDVRFTVSGGDEVIRPLINWDGSRACVRIMLIGAGTTEITVTAHFPTFEVSKAIPITVEAVDESLLPTGASLDRNVITTQPGEAFAWPVVSYDRNTDLTAQVHYEVSNQIDFSKAFSIMNEDGTVNPLYTLEEPGVYEYEMICDLLYGITFRLNFTVYCGVTPAVSEGDFDSALALQIVNGENGWGFGSGIVKEALYATITPTLTGYEQIHYDVAVTGEGCAQVRVDTDASNAATLFVKPTSVGTATFTLFATIDDTVYRKDISLCINEFTADDCPASVRMNQNTVTAQAGVPFAVPGYVPVPSGANLVNLPDGHREFRVIGYDNLSDGHDYSSPADEYTSYVFDEPGIYYCQLVFGVGYNVEVTSDVFTVMVDTQDNNFNRMFWYGSAYGYGMPTVIFGGEESVSFGEWLSLMPGTGLSSFTVNEIVSGDPDILQINWSNQDGGVQIDLIPKGFGPVHFFIGLQDNNGINYRGDFDVELVALPDDWAEPTVSIDGIQTGGTLVTGVNDAFFTVPYHINGDYAGLFESHVSIYPLSQIGKDHFIDQGDHTYYFDRPGIYPMKLWSYYRNYDLYFDFNVAVRDADGNMPMPTMDTYFSFNWNRDGVNGALYFAPEQAVETWVGSIALLDSIPENPDQVSYTVVPLAGVGEEPCATVRLLSPEEGSARRDILVMPNAAGAPGISAYRLTATIQREEGESPTVVSADFEVNMQAVNGLDLLLAGMQLTKNVINLDYHAPLDGEDDYQYTLQWPGIILPAGAALSTDKTVVRLCHVASDTGIRYAWGDRMDERVLAGQEVSGIHYGSRREVLNMIYEVTCGNLRRDLPFRLCVGVGTHDASALFSVNTNDSPIFYVEGSERNVWGGNFWNERTVDVTSKSIAFVSGDDPDMGLACYSDQDYNTEPHTQTDIGFNITPTRTGTSVVRLSVVSGGETYWHDFTLTVLPLPEGLPTDFTFAGDDTLTLRENEPFALPLIEEDILPTDMPWSCELNLENMSEALESNEQWGEHSAYGGDFRYWINTPGRYAASYTLTIGANYCLVKPFTLYVTDETDTLPVLETAVYSRRWGATLSTVGTGGRSYDLSMNEVPDVLLREGDTEIWSYSVDSAQTTGACARYFFRDRHSMLDGGSSYAQLAAQFPAQEGKFWIRAIYDVYDQSGAHIYHGEGEMLDFLITSEAEQFQVQFEPGQTEYTADEHGYVHITPLTPFAEGYDLARGPIGTSFWLESGPSTDDAQIDYDDSQPALGCNLRLNPGMPGTYILCQDAWTHTQGIYLNSTARIRVTVGDPAQGGIALHSEDGAYEEASLRHSDTVDFCDYFWVDGVADGDSVTWQLDVLEGDSIRQGLFYTADNDEMTKTETASAGQSPSCNVFVKEISHTGATRFRMLVHVQTPSGVAYTDAMEYTINVTDDADGEGFLPVINTPLQTSYRITAGEVLFIPEPAYTLPDGASQDSFKSFWNAMDGIALERTEENGVPGADVISLTPGYYSVRFCVYRAYSVRPVNIHVIVTDAEGNVPAPSPSMLVTRTVDGDHTSLDTVVSTPPYQRSLLGSFTLTGVALADGDTSQFVLDAPAGSPYEVVLKQRTDQEGYLVVSRPATNLPDAQYTLRAVVNGTTLASMAFTVSSETDVIYVSAIQITNSGSDTLKGLGTVQLNASVSPENADNAAVTWSVPAGAAALVDENGLITAQDVDEPADVTVTAAAQDGSGITGTYLLHIVPRIKTIEVSGSATMLGGSMQQLGLAIQPDASSDKVRWQTSDPAVATVSDSGLLTAADVLEPSVVTVTATADDGSLNPEGKLVTGSLSVTVNPVVRVKTVEIDKTVTSLTGLCTLQLSATVTPDNPMNGTLRWDSSDQAVATVDANGLVRALDVGETRQVTITATATDTGAVADHITLTVAPRIHAVRISGPSTVLEGQAVQLTAATSPTGASSAVTWTSDNTAIATVDENGLVTGCSVSENQTVTITAQAADLAGIASAPVVKDTYEVTVQAMINASAVTIGDVPAELMGLGSAQLTATITPADATNKTPIWRSDNEAVATVNASGRVTAADVDAKTSVIMTATADDETHVYGEATLHITPRIKGITVTGSADMLQGTSQTLTASVTPADAKKLVRWSSRDETVATVDQTGKVTTLPISETKSVIITATANDGTAKPDGSLVACAFEITVRPLTSAIAVRVSDAAGNAATQISLDSAEQTLRLTATVTPSDASGSLDWAVADATVLTVDANNDGIPDVDAQGRVIVTGLNPGATTVTASSRDGSGVTGTSAVIEVTKQPTDIGTYGKMALSVGMKAQINAAAIADGYLGGKPITRYTAMSDCVSVSASGLVTALSPVENAQIKLETADRATYAYIRVDVANAPDALVISVGGSPVSGYVFEAVGNQLDVEATAKNGVKDVPATLTAVCQNPAIATVTDGGDNRFTLKATGLGSTAVTFTTYNGVSATLNITVACPLRGVTLSAPATVSAGKSAVVQVTFDPVNATNKDLTWRCAPSDPAQAVGFNPALVTISRGILSVSAALDRVVQITVTAASEDLENPATCNLWIVPLTQSLTISEGVTALTTPYGGTNVMSFSEAGTPIALQADLMPEKLADFVGVQWSTSASSVAQVDTCGYVTVLKPGDAVITATATDGSKKSGTFKLSVRNFVTGLNVTDAAKATSGQLVANTKTSLTLTASAIPLNATNKAVAWSVRYADKDELTPFLTVTAAGIVTVNTASWIAYGLSGQHEATVVATAQDGSEVTGEYAVTVLPMCTGVQISTIGTRDVTGDALTFDLNEGDAQGQLPLMAETLPEGAMQTLLWKSSNPACAKVTQGADGWYVELLKPTTAAAPTVTLTAAATDGSGKTAAVKLTILCSPTDVEISGPASVGRGKAAQYTANVQPLVASNRAVKWSVAAEGEGNSLGGSVITSSGKLTVGAAASGELTVRAVCAAKDTVDASFIVEVTDTLAESVSLQPDDGDNSLEVTNPADNQLTVTAVALPEGASQEFVWSSSNVSVAAVSTDTATNRATVTAIGPGAATIKAMATDGSGKYAAYTVSVSCKPVAIRILGAAGTLLAGKSLTLSTMMEPAKASNAVAWSFSDAAGNDLITQPTIASLSATGVLTAKADATAIAPSVVYVRAFSENYAGNRITAVYPVTVYQPSASVRVYRVNAGGAEAPAASNAIDLGKGETTLRLGAEVSPGAAMQNVAYTSSNPTIAQVDAEGTVTALRVGTVTVTATTADGLRKKGTYQVSIGVMTTALTFDSPDTTMTAGGKLNLTVTAAPSNITNTKLLWVSSDTSIAKVSTAGAVTASAKVTAVQTVDITATAQDGSGVTGKVTLTVRPRATGVLLFDKDGAPISAGTTLPMNLNTDSNTLALSAMCTSIAASGLTVTDEAMQGIVWSTSSPSIATVANGEVTAVSEGVATITATAADGSKKSASVKVAVTCKAQGITVSGPTGVAFGKSVKLTAQIAPAGVSNKTVTWALATDADKALASVSATTGVVTAKNVASLAGSQIGVTATTKALGIAGVPLVSDTYRLTVYARTTQVTTNYGTGKASITADLYKGQLQLSAVCQPIDTALQSVAWSTSNAKIATVGQDGLVTFLAAGTVTITATANDGTGVKTALTISIR